ncbi:MAG: hypothetical protein ACYDH4_10755 [Candidatus Cryosericum sp.]
MSEKKIDKKLMHEVLSKLADAAEAEADAHEDHDDCMVGEIAAVVGIVAREGAASCGRLVQTKNGRTKFVESGPAQVATQVYRDGYETIFGKKAPVGQA